MVLHFNKGLNILIGENNVGKTAIIDALRLCLGYGNQKREVYISLSDFCVNKNTIEEELKDIQFDLFFQIEEDIESALFLDMLNTYEDASQDLQLHFKYYFDKTSLKKVKYKNWGGKNEGQSVATEVLQQIYHVHLDALRDAELYLRPTKGNMLGQLYSNIQIDIDSDADREKKKEIAKKVKSAINEDSDWLTHINKGKKKINEHLQETCFSHKQQQVEIDFLPFDFNRLVDNLKIQIPVYPESLIAADATQQKHFEVYQNGLGYNNLIYAATVLGDLKQKKELDKNSYIALLIEEPEAHLHPQLQNLFFNYLNKLDTEEGFQVFITSHSPTITAKADLKSLIVLQNDARNVYSTSLINSGLSETNRQYLHKFLDVTKSQLFFANGVILVEGISEALLLPIFSTMISPSLDLDKNGIEIINLNGVAFEHFAKLFNNEDESKNLKSRCSILTDDDRNVDTDEISSRAKIAKDLENKKLKVFLSENTFEFELFIAGNNKEILLAIFSEMHPTSCARIVSDINIKKYASNFMEKLVSNKAKSELAHQLAVKLISDPVAMKDFTIPNYIKDAIKYVIKGDLNV
jgi:putative ATP-dependent endonuclease of the OLD family